MIVTARGSSTTTDVLTQAGSRTVMTEVLRGPGTPTAVPLTGPSIRVAEAAR